MHPPERHSLEGPLLRTTQRTRGSPAHYILRDNERDMRLVPGEPAIIAGCGCRSGMTVGTPCPPPAVRRRTAVTRGQRPSDVSNRPRRYAKVSTLASAGMCLRGTGTWRSLVAHLTGGQGVAGSNPAVPTQRKSPLTRSTRRPRARPNRSAPGLHYVPGGSPASAAARCSLRPGRPRRLRARRSPGRSLWRPWPSRPPLHLRMILTVRARSRVHWCEGQAEQDQDAGFRGQDQQQEDREQRPGKRNQGPEQGRRKAPKS